MEAMMYKMAKLDERVRALLDEQRFAVVATINRDGTPQQTVLWYYRDGDDIVMNTARGRVKDSNLLRDPRLSFCIEDEYHYITLTGTVTLIDDQTVAQADIRKLAIRYHGEAQGNAQADTQFVKQERVTIRMRVERVVVDLD
jgi:PPOX class probable F420-dependent enzyme